MFKVQWLNSWSWVDYFIGYGEQDSIIKAQQFSASSPDKKIRVIYEDKGRPSVVCSFG